MIYLRIRSKEFDIVIVMNQQKGITKMKCISIDLDGTLLNSKHEVSDANLDVLKKLEAEGHCVVLNTGRAFADVIKIKAIDKMAVPIFCVNGSVLYSKTRDILFEATISIEVYKQIFTTLKKLGVGILVYTNHGGFPSTLPPLQHKSKEELDTLFQEYNYDQILEVNDLKIYKLIALVHHDQLDKIGQVNAALTGNLPITMASSFPNNVEITSNEAHKGKALLRYQEMMELSFDEIIAFGDGGNDLAQFEVATTSVAMGNAPLKIQQKADMIAKTNDEDGFAYAVMHQLNLFNTVEKQNN
jgi:Cof subfamily protein (haloacid dehalogenase superfamily)